MNRNERKNLAQDTLRILDTGCYVAGAQTINMQQELLHCVESSVLLTPEQGAVLLEEVHPPESGDYAPITLDNCSTLEAVFRLRASESGWIGVLNFASAKNPGGGFLGGSLAQEESLALSSTLYACQLRQPDYYEANRGCGTMRYTDHAIYSPDVVFFRDDDGILLERPVTASVLTLPAVNYGQVLHKGEDRALALKTMRRRMALSLAIFAARGDEHLVLGAYGCGVFRNDPGQVARWWRELLLEEGYGRLFQTITFAVLDRSKSQSCIWAFQDVFSGEEESHGAE